MSSSEEPKKVDPPSLSETNKSALQKTLVWQEQMKRSLQIASQARRAFTGVEHLSTSVRIPPNTEYLTSISLSIANLGLNRWSTDLSEAIFKGRQSSAALEAIRRTKISDTLARFDQSRLNAVKFDTNSILSAEIQRLEKQTETARCHLKSLGSGIAAELRRLQESMAVFRVDPKLTRAVSDFSSSLKHFQPQFQAISKAIEIAAGRLRPAADILQRLAEDERIAQFILDLGFVPHGEIWDYIIEIDRPESSDIASFSEQLVCQIWPKLAQNLRLEMQKCMGDAKLYETYSQMLAAHSTGLYEMVMNSVPTVLERSVSLARRDGEPIRTFEWLKTEVAELPIYLAGGSRGYRVWEILIDHTFASCWKDADADATRYPNRHAAAHGIGKRVASNIDSLNAILLTHFVITTAHAVREYKSPKAA
jgi:hypothetical protein